MSPRKKKSVANAGGLEGKSNLIAKIYFAYDSSTLDPEDAPVLQFLARHFAHVLLQKRGEFSFIGFTDHRGQDAYNLDLGRRRAQAAQRYFDGVFGNHPNYTSWRAITRGEQYAAQGRPTDEQMAEDRRVEIRGSLSDAPVPKPKPHPHPVPNQPLVKRFAQRHFWKTDPKANKPSSDSKTENLNELLKSLIKIATKATLPAEWALGDEDVRQRKVVFVPAHYRVNVMTIDKQLSYTSLAGGEITNVFTTLDYAWNVPNDFLLLESSYTATIMGERNPTIREHKRIPRHEADSNALTFPGDPDKT